MLAFSITNDLDPQEGSNQEEFDDEEEGDEEGELMEIDLDNMTPEELKQLAEEHPELMQQLLGEAMEGSEYDEDEEGSEEYSETEEMGSEEDEYDEEEAGELDEVRYYFLYIFIGVSEERI